MPEIQPSPPNFLDRIAETIRLDSVERVNDDLLKAGEKYPSFQSAAELPGMTAETQKIIDRANRLLAAGKITKDDHAELVDKIEAGLDRPTPKQKLNFRGFDTSRLADLDLSTEEGVNIARERVEATDLTDYQKKLLERRIRGSQGTAKQRQEAAVADQTQTQQLEIQRQADEALSLLKGKLSPEEMGILVKNPGWMTGPKFVNLLNRAARLAFGDEPIRIETHEIESGGELRRLEGAESLNQIRDKLQKEASQSGFSREQLYLIDQVLQQIGLTRVEEPWNRRM